MAVGSLGSYQSTLYTRFSFLLELDLLVRLFTEPSPPPERTLPLALPDEGDFSLLFLSVLLL